MLSGAVEAILVGLAKLKIYYNFNSFKKYFIESAWPAMPYHYTSHDCILECRSETHEAMDSEGNAIYPTAQMRNGQDSAPIKFKVRSVALKLTHAH